MYEVATFSAIAWWKFDVLVLDLFLASLQGRKSYRAERGLVHFV